jgi:hypothetical protein
MGNYCPLSKDRKSNIVNSRKISKKFEDEDFDDMEEIKEDIYIGIGIKKMKGYKCDLKINELNKLREHFWEVKTNHCNKNWVVWNTIKRAVEYDESRSSLLLKEYNIKPVNGCINHLVDSKGNYYKIPNYCINDPYFEKIIVDENNVKEEKIKVKLYGWKNLEIEINNKLKGTDLKNEIRMKEKIEEDYIIKLFYKGAEIKDDDYLYKHDLNENYPVMLKVFNNS